MDNNSYRLLVIEDNVGDFVLLECYLHEQFGAASTVHVSSFTAARDILDDVREHFDAILLDLSLPDKAGQELIDAVLPKCPDTPVIILTGYGDMEFAARSLGMGVSDYIQKDEITSVVLYKSIIYSIERKNAMQALRQSQQQYSELFHFSPQPMWVRDAQSLKFLDVNRAAIEHYGYSREEFLSVDSLDQDSSVGKPGEAGQGCHPKVVQHQKKDGSGIQVEIHISPIVFMGMPAEMVLVWDVSEKLAYVSAIEAQNKQLKEISWIQSHVVRAPLARIMGLVSLLDHQGEETELIGHLSASAQELDHVIRSITQKIHSGSERYFKN